MTATDPNSDYDTPSTDLFQLLPDPYQSDTNRSIMSNLFNRYLSKNETVHAVGYIGQGNPAANVSRQLKEPTVHRQAYQLQPILYEKIGSVEHISSWYDILNGLTAQGVDVGRQGNNLAAPTPGYNGWASALEFNWVPPIDINKIVNYRDYYWYDPSNVQSQPQYITVKSECASAMALANFYQNLITQNGATFTIVGLIPAMSSIIITGNFTTLFAPNFIFFIENSTNPQLNNSFFQVLSSSYDSGLNETSIVITTSFTNGTNGGDISLTQQLSIYQGIAQCKCTGESGWDTLPWDDNQPTNPPPLWNAAVIADIEFATLAQWVTAHPSPQQYDIWWDNTSDTLWSLQSPNPVTLAQAGDITNWKLIYNNFSLIEEQTTGAGYWDLTTGCAGQAVITGLDQWITQNKWVHKADITNFSIAKQAQIPIIEFEPNLELSEWTNTTYTWEYRSSIQNQFAATTITPTRLELEPLNLYTNTTSTITLDERYGDLTPVFIPGFNFLIAGIDQLWTVQSSTFKRVSVPYGAFQTSVTVTQPLPVLTPSINYIYPQLTSAGDPFTKYGDQWLFVGVNTTTAINHQAENNMMDPSMQPATLDVSGNFQYKLQPYAEEFDIINTGVTTLTLNPAYIPTGSTRTLQQRSLVGTNDIRVYKNGIRQYGTYDENGTVYVTGITFFTPLQALDVVLIQVGEATYQDFGNYAVPVRTILNDIEFASVGPQLVSLVQYRLAEQVKSAVNQYPLFDIYLTNSQPAGIANPIFAYHESPTGVLYTYVGQRIVQAADGSIEFQNYLVKSNNGPLYAYRNYNKSVHQYWYNTNTSTVYVWTGETWSPKYETSGGVWLAPLVQAGLPVSPITGLIVYNTVNNTLQQWNGSAWISLSVNISTSDETLETNWRHGTGNEQFIAQQVDWQQRSYATYLTQYNAYIVSETNTLLEENPTWTQAEAEAEANTLWTNQQEKSINQAWYTDQTLPAPVREGPIWIGNWQIPDPLYFNVEHEDWLYISATDLFTHFESIVKAQPSFPGFGGQASANWRLIDYTNINWGLGGTIKEYDNSFDTFLSSQFIDTVTPPSLFTFAQSQYEDIIVLLRDLLTRNFVTYMTNTTTAVILDPSDYAATQVLTAYEENEAANLVYGDSTTFTQATATTPASGVENWIATLPFFGIVPKVQPYIYNDPDLGITGIMHHDGHRQTYLIPQVVVVGLQQVIVNTPDPRAPGEKFGRISTLNPPVSQAVFGSQFSTNYRNGVYWLKGSTLYRIVVANVGTTPPSIAVPIGSLWWDTTGIGQLKQQTALNVWTPAIAAGLLYDGATVETSDISAWEVVSLNEIYLDVILNAEELLYLQVPPAPINPPLNFATLQAEDPTLYQQYLQEQFNNYCIELQIATPFVNNTFNAVDPFTWNYKYSTPATLPTAKPYVSGGTWQDVYQKTYGTPYPHLEPWVLQGYTNKPTWWDSKFVNNNETYFGFRRWRYNDGIPVLAKTLNTIVFNGDQTPAFAGLDSFTVYYTDNISKAVFTFTTAVYALGVTTVTVAQPTTSVTVGALATVGMWDYVLRGAIPTGEVPPLVPVPAYSYVSVNITNNPIFTGPAEYKPDDVFPPYWDYRPDFTATPTAINLPVRSIFDSLAEITLENSDYLWNDAGPIQWMWQQTTNYLYSLVTVAYLMEPVRTIQAIFGTKFNYIDGLPIDSLTGQVFSHTNTQFHGEITVNNQIVRVNGINQWYVNFNRFSGLDTSYSDFRALWTAWTAPLTYLFASFIDTTSLDVQHRIVSISPSDYNITIKRSPGVANYWIDAFKVLITNIPPNFALYDTQNEWELSLNSFAPISRTISYYGIQQYDFYPDVHTNICSLFTYPVVSASVAKNAFIVGGDVSQIFGLPNGAAQFIVTGNNAGTYTVVSANYDPVLKQTTIVASGATIVANLAGSFIQAINYRTLPWTTGTLVNLTTTTLLPLPLDSSLQYFVKILTPTTFQLFYNQLDLTANIPIIFTSNPVGIQRVGSVFNSFLALNGINATPLWYHYNLDTTIVKELTLPTSISGIQNFINIVDGYAAYEKAQGYGINVSGAYTDPATNQPVSWQNEVERFIDWAYQQRSVRRSRINNKYAVDLNYGTGAFTFTSQNPGYLPGTEVVVWSFGGGLPPPLLIGQSYFIINNPDGTVSLASNYQNAIANVAITISFVGGVGQLYISNAELFAAELPTYEVNPFRNALWFSPPYGIVSNVIVGPFADIFSEQLIFDQYGRRLSPSDVRVFRQDKITQIQYAGGVYNDVNVVQNAQRNPYQYLHIGGANLFLDTYEHELRFNNYTTNGALIYDPFLGLNVTKFELDFYKQDEFTERPNVGGYFLSQPFNQGGSLLQNIEGSVEDLRYMYDPYSIPETLPAVVRSRALLGYTGVKDFLSQINLTAKSQFLFWKGAIHNKGSLNAITAFINSRRFVNAKVDEFWAYKIADFGPVKVPEYLSMYLTTNDTITNDLRLQFELTDQVCLPGYAEEVFGDTSCGYANPPNSSVTVNGVDPTFTPIAMDDQSRWFNQPDVLEALVPDGGVLYFDLEPKQKLVIYTAATVAAFIASDVTPLTTEVGVIINTPTIVDSQTFNYSFWTYNGSTFVFAGGWNPAAVPATLPILRHNFMADTVTMTMDWYPGANQTTYNIPALPTNNKVLALTVPYLPLTNSLSVFKDDVQLQPGVDYVESLEQFPPALNILGTDGAGNFIVAGNTYLSYFASVAPNTETFTVSGAPANDGTYRIVSAVASGLNTLITPSPAAPVHLAPAGGTLQANSVLGYKLYFADTISGSKIEVVYGPNQLGQDTQFQIVNTNIVNLLSQQLVANLFANDSTLTIWGLEVNKEAQNPAYVIDTKSNTTLTPVTFWDPARGYHYYEALNTVDVQSNTDPANYDITTGGLAGWKNNQVGVTWLDTTNLTYLPYYDTLVEPTAAERFANWGQLASNGVIDLFEWTSSPVPPDQYNALAAVQEGDNSINPAVRLSGTARQDVRFRNRANTTAVASPSTQGKTVITIGASTIVSTDSTGLNPAVVPPIDPTYTSVVTVNGTPEIVSALGSNSSTYADLVATLNKQLSGAVVEFNTSSPNTFQITSKTIGATSSILLSPDAIFTAILGYTGVSAPVPGTDSTHGTQNIVLPGSGLTPNTATGLPYTAAVADKGYTVTLATVGLNTNANDQQQAWFSTSESRTWLGSQLATFADLVNFFKTFNNITVTNTPTSITLTNTVVCPNASYPSIVAIETDSLLANLPVSSIVATQADTAGGFGNVVINFSGAFTNTGLAPVTLNDPTFGFNISIDNGPQHAVTVLSSLAQTYGGLLAQLNTSLGGIGANANLSNHTITIGSNSVGSNSNVVITNDAYETLFSTLGGTIVPSTPGVNGTVGYQIIHTGSHLPSDLTGLTPTSPTVPVYAFTITVDGTFTRTNTYLPSQVGTYADLLRVLSKQLAVYNTTIALVNNTLVITSNTVGPGSAISITGDTLFNNITNYISNVAVPGVAQVITLASALPVGTNNVIFSSTGTLPAGLSASTVYPVTIVGTALTVTGVTITNAGSGVLTVANATTNSTLTGGWPNSWILSTQQSINLDASIDATLVGTTYSFAQTTTTFPIGQVLNVYVNGVVVQTNYTLTSGGLVFDGTTFPVINRQDRITLIVPVPVLTSTELAFNPATADDGTTQTQYQYITNYVATQQFDVSLNAPSYTYYFWVQNKTTSVDPSIETISQAAADILAPPAPYMFFAAPVYGGNNGQPLPPVLVANIETGETITEPYRFTQAIVHGLRGYVDDDNRYVLRFTRDFTLRDNLAFGTSPLQLKAYHQEWLMFREQQLSNVPLALWNKITEAMAGYLLTDPSTRVPSLARQLYDEANNTSTQYGLGTNQAFCNGPTAISVITSYLNDPTNNFYPLDMDLFFATYNFNTPANCIATMNQIYNTFSYINVNKMFFSVLLNAALDVQQNYKSLMKTSAIALYGIELLDVQGVFDD